MLGLLLAAALGPAHATYSVVATDSATGEVGGAGTSCVGAMAVSIIYGSAPGHGAVHAQSYVNTEGRDEAARLLAEDVSPDEVIAAITDAGFDTSASWRQYGVADLSGRAAGYTGADNGSWAGDVQGTVGSYTYSIQGNILTSAAVVSSAEAAFVDEAGCDLADRLMRAVEAGALDGEGDSRCTTWGLPSDAGFVRVQDAAGADLLFIEVTDTRPVSPLVLLREQFDLWRTEHACPEPDPEPVETGDTDPPGDAGCTCHGGAAGGWGAGLLALAALIARRRRRRARR